jgi:hypothetical protein
VFTAVPRFAVVGLFASTRRMLHCGHTAETISMSSAISDDQPEFEAGSGLAAPFWLTLWKQPLAVVHAGSPNWLR